MLQQRGIPGVRVLMGLVSLTNKHADTAIDQALWRMKLYQQALFLGELAWFDVCKVFAEYKTYAN